MTSSIQRSCDNGQTWVPDFRYAKAAGFMDCAAVTSPHIGPSLMCLAGCCLYESDVVFIAANNTLYWIGF